MSMTQHAKHSITRLEEIALKPNPLPNYNEEHTLNFLSNQRRKKRKKDSWIASGALQKVKERAWMLTKTKDKDWRGSSC